MKPDQQMSIILKTVHKSRVQPSVGREFSCSNKFFQNYKNPKMEYRMTRDINKTGKGSSIMQDAKLPAAFSDVYSAYLKM
jgi:hypothetical protein